MKRENNGKMRIIPLGGLEKIGMNITAFEYEDSIIVVDCGLSFPEEDMLGIDLVIPDVTYLKDNIQKVKGFVITHGHEDHIGGIPFLLQSVNIPVIYAPKIATDLINKKLEERNINYKNIELINKDLVLEYKYFKIEFVNTTHSIPDSFAICIHTPNWTIFETGDFKFDFSKVLTNDFEVLNERIERKLTLINDMVNERLDKNFEKSNKTFNNVLERLSKIDEAQRKIDDLGADIISLQGVLTDKKTRGTFGEVNLEYILNNAFGPASGGIYNTQVKFDNGYIVDALLYAPSPLGTISIDSKFPLENYQKMVNRTFTKEQRLAYEKLFVQDVKKHINDIKNKYIVPGVTTDEAIMFLPAEAIFAEINAYHPELITYAYNNKVWITGPTTLISTLSTISMIIKNIERDKYAKVIHEELNKLSVEFSRYKDRWEKLSKNIKAVNNSVDELTTTTDKITKKFDAINKVEIKEIEVKNDKN